MPVECREFAESAVEPRAIVIEMQISAGWAWSEV